MINNNDRRLAEDDIRGGAQRKDIHASEYTPDKSESGYEQSGYFRDYGRADYTYASRHARSEDDDTNVMKMPRWDVSALEDEAEQPRRSYSRTEDPEQPHRNYSRTEGPEQPRRSYSRTGESAEYRSRGSGEGRYDSTADRRPTHTAPEYRNGSRGDEPSPIYGGREHDNIPAADMRPQIGKKPAIIMLMAAFVLIIVVTILVNGSGSRVSLALNTDKTRPSAQAVITAQDKSAPAASALPGSDAQATAQQTAQATATPTPDNIIVSAYTGRTLDKAKPAVALTFDDGPSDQTPRILDTLAQYDGRATFFLVGSRLEREKYAAIAKREYDMGCLVGTHLYSHDKLTGLSSSQIKGELDECNAAHQSATGATPEVARPPYGSANDTVKQTLNMPLINWSLNSNDWETRDADRIYNDVMNNIQDGDIVLFHDLKDFSASAIERIVPALSQNGYQIVTVQELFELKGRNLESGVVYSKRITALDSSAG